MAEIEIHELRLYEPVCTDCGKAGPIEESEFAASAWERAHDCAAAEPAIAVAS